MLTLLLAKERFGRFMAARCVSRTLTGFSIPSSSSRIRVVRSFSVLNRPAPKYEGHIPLTSVERASLAIGSALGSILNPRRGGNAYAVLGGNSVDALQI